MNPSAIRRLSKIDRLFLWHPFTQMREYAEEEPLIVESGRGAWLRDVLGNRYLDAVSSIWLNIHGHRNPRIDEAIRRQLGKIAHSTLLGLSNVPAIELAQRLVRIAPPGLRHVFYSDSGSEAVEIALKMAFGYWQHRRKKDKRVFVSLKNAYHGDTVGAMSVGNIDLFHAKFRPLLFDTLAVPSPDPYHCNPKHTPADCLEHSAQALERVLKKHHRKIIAVVTEPLIQAAAGMIVWPRGFLKRVASLCRRHGVLLIVDEVATGFGRTGKMFACQHEGVRPDIMAVAKGLTGGYLPLAATIANEKVYSAYLGRYDQFKTFFHGHSYTGNPLGCAAALATLDIFEKEKTLSRVGRLGQIMAKRLRDLQSLAHVGDCRRLGLMGAVELMRDKKSRRPYALKEKVGMRVARVARSKGVLLRPLGSIMVIMPPLSIREKELHTIMDVLRESIKEATG